ncbi:MAG: hypothetical protein ACTHON_18260 [Humibacter sp.]
MTKTQLADIGERAGWTLAQAAVGFAITEAASIPGWWTLPLATALSAAKTYIQHQLDKRKTAEVGP